VVIRVDVVVGIFTGFTGKNKQISLPFHVEILSFHQQEVFLQQIRKMPVFLLCMEV
jgi:hypothetical protein